jgi:hypothetical protein
MEEAGVLGENHRPSASNKLILNEMMMRSALKKPEYSERTIDHRPATGKLYHLRLRIDCTIFVIYKAGLEPTIYRTRGEHTNHYTTDADKIAACYHVLNKSYIVYGHIFNDSTFDLNISPGRTKDYKIGICFCFSAKNAELRRKSKDWLVRSGDNVSEWCDMSVRGLLFQ